MCRGDRERTEAQNSGLSLIYMFAVVSVVSLYWKLPSVEQMCISPAFLKIKCGNLMTTLFLLLC